MKKLLCLCTAMAIIFTAAAAMAADVTGAWSGSADTPNGVFPLTFTFKQDGAALTGTVQGAQSEPMEITNGKIDGNNFTFDVSFNGMTIHHDCTLDGDQIQMTTKSDSGDFPGMKLTLKRANAAPGTPHQIRAAHPAAAL